MDSIITRKSQMVLKFLKMPVSFLPSSYIVRLVILVIIGRGMKKSVLDSQKPKREGMLTLRISRFSRCFGYESDFQNMPLRQSGNQ